MGNFGADDMHSMVREAVREAELKISHYANQKRQHVEIFEVGTLVRLSLDGVNLNQFKFRSTPDLVYHLKAERNHVSVVLTTKYLVVLC